MSGKAEIFVGAKTLLGTSHIFIVFQYAKKWYKEGEEKAECSN